MNDVLLPPGEGQQGPPPPTAVASPPFDFDDLFETIDAMTLFDLLRFSLRLSLRLVALHAERAGL